MKNCENCNNTHSGTYGSGRFCNEKCARGFSTKDKRKLINEKVSLKLKGNLVNYFYNCEKCETDFISIKKIKKGFE